MKPYASHILAASLLLPAGIRCAGAADNKQVLSPMTPGIAVGHGFGGQPLHNSALQSSAEGGRAKANARNDRGSAYYKNGEYEKAITEYSAAIALNPRDAAFRNNRGNAYYMLNKYQEALNDFNGALELKPDLKEALATRDAILGRLERIKMAVALRSRPEILRKKAVDAPPAVPGAVSLPNPGFSGREDARQVSGWSRPRKDLSLPEAAAFPFEFARPAAGNRTNASWLFFCAAGLLLAAAAFPCVMYLVLRSERDALLKELQPLADQLGVNMRWLLFGFFIPPESGFYARLQIGLAIYSALGFLAACFVFFSFPKGDAIKILSGALLSGAFSCAAAFSSYALKTGRGKKSRTEEERAPERTKTRSSHRKISSPAQNRGPVAAAAPPAPVSPAYDPGRIEGLMKAGRYKEALEAFSTKDPLKITDSDRIFLFEIYLRLGDHSRAGNLFESLKGSQLLIENMRHYKELAAFCREHKEPGLARLIGRGLFDTAKAAISPAAAPSSYYDLADFCEKQEDVELARDIFRFMLDADLGGYRDASARYDNLKDRAFASAAPPMQAGASAGRQFPGAGVSLPGTILDKKYELKSELGEGGMAMVYEGWDRTRGKKVAVKKMHPWLKKYPVERDRFIREARIVSKLNHPNIVGVQGIVEQEGEIYLIFDYVDGRTLSDLLKEKGSLPFQDCKRILKGVCEAISYAHRNNIIHRDLKPGNIMLDKSGSVLVMDFGLASELRESFTRVTHQTSSGTPAYMGPEQYQGIVKRESDIYAIGVCLYEMLTGKLPFPAGDIMQMKNDKAFTQISAMLPWLPSGLDGLIARSLEPEPAHRYADPMDLFRALDKL